MKKSIPYSQALRFKRICSSIGLYKENCENLKKQLIKKGYKESLPDHEIKKVDEIDRKLLFNSPNQQKTKNILPLSIIYNRSNADLKSVLLNYWHILNINPELRNVFSNKPTIAFCKDKNIKQIIGGNAITNDKKEI